MAFADDPAAKVAPVLVAAMVVRLTQLMVAMAAAADARPSVARVSV